jgi:hypothetical protein
MTTMIMTLSDPKEEGVMESWKKKVKVTCMYIEIVRKTNGWKRNRTGC